MKKVLIGFLFAIMTASLTSCGSTAEKSGTVDNSKEIEELQKQIDELKAENEKLKAGVNSTVENVISEGQTDKHAWLNNFTAELSGVLGYDITWEYGNGVVWLHGTGEEPVAVIPFEEFGVERDKIKYVFVDEGITSIGGFVECLNLSEVILPSTIK